ncbi:MAG: hypothetical protein Fur006_52120 [Coleofasciculaceae cyanobacterium]
MRSNGLRLLKVAEYTALAASVAGVVISTASKQVVYAAAPLSLSMFLNLLNRQRFEQQTQQSITTTAAQVEQQLSQLNRGFSRLQQEVRNELNQQLQALDARVTSSQPTQVNLPTELERVEQRLSELTSNVTREIQSIHQLLQSQVSVVNPTTLQNIQQGLSGLQERIADFESLDLGLVPQNLSQLQTQFEQRLLQLQQSISSLRQQLPSQQSTLELATLPIVQQELAQLQNRIAAIESFNFRSVLETITQLQGQYDSLRASTDSFDQRLESFPSTGWVNNLQEEIIQVQAGLEQLRIDFPQQQDNLYAELTQLQNELQALVEQLPSARRLPETETLPIALTPSTQVENIPESISTSIGEVTGGSEKVPEAELELLYINIGIDFGTSFTKVCFRDIGQDRSEVVTFTDGQANLDETLVLTQIAILADGTLRAGLTKAEWAAIEQQIKTPIKYIKMRLADLDITQESDRWRLDRLPELDRPETVENLCAYYLSRVITRAQSWIRCNKPDLVKNQKIEWSANVGVPVEYCDSPAIARFKKVLSLAWLLSNEPQTELFTLESLGQRLNQMRSRIADNPIDCHAIPEISAEVWSCLNSREFDDGFYTFFDVGCGTLDGVSFRYWRDEGEPKVDFYSASVKPLGVSAISQCLASELNISEDQVRREILQSSDSDLTQLNSTQSRKQIQQLVGRVVMEGRQKHGIHRPVFKDLVFEHGLSVLIGGGGSLTSFYKITILGTHSAFQHQKAGIPSYDQKAIPIPKDFSMNGLSSQDFHRFAVAYGLSIPEGDCPEIRLPSEMDKADSQTIKTTISSERLRYEDTRDSC